MMLVLVLLSPVLLGQNFYDLLVLLLLFLLLLFLLE